MKILFVGEIEEELPKKYNAPKKYRYLVKYEQDGKLRTSNKAYDNYGVARDTRKNLLAHL